MRFLCVDNAIFICCLKKIITLVPYMRPQIVTKLTSVLCFFASTAMLAQSPGGGSGPPPPTTPPPELPLDSSLSILLVAALIYGSYVAVKRWRSKDVPA